MPEYSREQIYDAMRRADAAGDGEAVKALAAALKAGASKEQIVAQAADSGLTVDEAALDANIASRDAGGQTSEFLPPKPQPTIGAGVQNALAGAAQGVAGIYDFAQDIGKLPTQGMNILARGVASGIDAVGIDPFGAANFLRTGANRYDQDLANMPSAAGKIEQLSPTPEGMGGARFAAQIIGGAAVPFGPKAAPRINAPVEGTISAARQVVDAGKREGVRVMTSDVKPPRTFIGKAARATGERIPFAGTGGPRMKQAEERVEAVKQLAKDFGVEGVENSLEEVADDLAKTRGGKIAALAGRKNKIIDDLSGPVDDAKMDLGEPSQLSTPRTPTEREVRTLSRVETISLESARRGNKLDWAKFGKGEDLVKGFGDKPLAVKLENGEYILIDGNHRATQALQRGAKSIEARVIDARAFDPANAGRRAAPKPTAAELDNLLAELGVGPASAAPPSRAVPTPKAVAEIDTQIARLKGINEAKLGPVIKELERFKGALTSGKSLREIEENRRLLGEMFEDQSLASVKGVGQKAINAVYAPLRDDMGAFIKANGGDEAFGAWKRSNDELAAMAGELDASSFKNVLQNAESTPENVARLLFSKKPSDVRRLYANLSTRGQEKARAAVLHEAIVKSGGIDEVSPQKFANALQKFGKTTGIVFGDDAPRIEGIVRLLKATQQASVAAAAPPTGVQNAPVIGAAVLTDWLGGLGAATSTAGLAGAAARLYESAAVRNLLTGLGKTKPGSKAEGAVIARIETALASQEGIGAKVANDNMGRSLAAEERREERRPQ